MNEWGRSSKSEIFDLWGGSGPHQKGFCVAFHVLH